MRLVVAVLACLGAGAMTPTLADPSSPAPQQPAAASSSSGSAPATPPASAASATQTPAPAAKPAVDPEEQRLLVQGYRPKMHHGQKVFCRTETPLGSRLGGQEICATVAELKAHHTAVREELERAQRTNTGTNGNGTGK
jgi:hypothetical protein